MSTKSKSVPGYTSGKESTRQSRRCRFNPWVRKILGGRNGKPSDIFAWEIPWAEKPDRLQPMGPKELDITERLSTITEARGQQSRVGSDR